MHTQGTVIEQSGLVQVGEWKTVGGIRVRGRIGMVGMGIDFMKMHYIHEKSSKNWKKELWGTKKWNDIKFVLKTSLEYLWDNHWNQL